MPERTQQSYQQLSNTFGQLQDTAVTIHTTRNRTRYQMTMNEWDNVRTERLNEFIRSHDPANESWRDDLDRLNSDLERDMLQRIGRDPQQQKWFAEDFSTIKSQSYNAVEQEFFQAEAQFAIASFQVDSEHMAATLPADEASGEIQKRLGDMLEAGFIRSDQALLLQDQANNLIVQSEARRIIHQGIEDRESSGMEHRTVFTSLRQDTMRRQDLTPELKSVMLQELSNIEQSDIQHRGAVERSNIETGLGMILRRELSSAANWFGLDSNPNKLQSNVWMEWETRERFLRYIASMEDAAVEGSLEDRHATNEQVMAHLWRHGYFESTQDYKDQLRIATEGGLISVTGRNRMRDNASRREQIEELAIFEPALNIIDESDLDPAQTSAAMDLLFGFLVREMYTVSTGGVEGALASDNRKITQTTRDFRTYSEPDLVNAAMNYVDALAKTPQMLDLRELGPQDFSFRSDGHNLVWETPIAKYYKRVEEGQMVAWQAWDEAYDQVEIGQMLQVVQRHESDLIREIHPDTNVSARLGGDGRHYYEVDSGQTDADGMQLVHLYRWAYNEDEDVVQLQRYFADPGNYTTQILDQELGVEVRPGEHWKFVDGEELQAIYNSDSRRLRELERGAEIRDESNRKAYDFVSGNRPPVPTNKMEAEDIAEAVINNLGRMLTGSTLDDINDRKRELENNLENYITAMAEAGVSQDYIQGFQREYRGAAPEAYRRAIQNLRRTNTSSAWAAGNNIRDENDLTQRTLDQLNAGEIQFLWSSE